MTKTTNIQNKTELLALSTKLGNELTAIEGEITAIKTKLDSASNYDGLNFEGAASVIKTNLTNVLTAMETLSSNISSYVTSLNEFDQYDKPLTEDDLTIPELTLPETPVVAPGEEEKPGETQPEETTPEETPKDETPKDETPVVTPTPPSQDEKPEETPTPDTTPNPGTDDKEEEEEKPTPQPQPQPKPTPKPNPSPAPSPQPQPDPTPEFKPEELDASLPVVVGKGDENYDVSKFSNNTELGYVVTTGNTSFELGEKDFDLLCAIIEAESDGTYDGTLAVASAVLNRCENAEYLQANGMDPIAQITALNQFEGYTTGEFQKYMNKNSEIVIEAVKAALAGVRNHTSCTLN